MTVDQPFEGTRSNRCHESKDDPDVAMTPGKPETRQWTPPHGAYRSNGDNDFVNDRDNVFF